MPAQQKESAEIYSPHEAEAAEIPGTVRMAFDFIRRARFPLARTRRDPDEPFFLSVPYEEYSNRVRIIPLPEISGYEKESRNIVVMALQEDAERINFEPAYSGSKLYIDIIGSDPKYSQTSILVDFRNPWSVAEYHDRRIGWPGTGYFEHTAVSYDAETLMEKLYNLEKPDFTIITAGYSFVPQPDRGWKKLVHCMARPAGSI